jgi:hypothetical protein
LFWGELNPPFNSKMETKIMLELLEGDFKSIAQKEKEQKIKSFLEGLNHKGVIRERIN